MATHWNPRSGGDEIYNCIWLPRMIDKARRVADSGGGYLIDGEYMFGEKDFADGRLLRFLGLSSAQVLGVVGVEPDDAQAAARIIELSGKTPPECAAFNRRFRLLMGPFLPMIDADEGRKPPGPWTAFLRGLYNNVIFRPALAIFRRSERV
jgi:hypothetical protein